jgi:hypothetical protein
MPPIFPSRAQLETRRGRRERQRDKALAEERGKEVTMKTIEPLTNMRRDVASRYNQKEMARQIGWRRTQMERSKLAR